MPEPDSYGMYALSELRDQHDAAMRMADRLLDMIDHYRCEVDALPIILQLNRLIGLLRVHLAQEDVQLELIGSPDPEIAKLARAYVSEIGGLAIDLELFARRWSSSAVIAGEFGEFSEASRDLILQLAVRIDGENRFLSSLAGTTGQAGGLVDQ